MVDRKYTAYVMRGKKQLRSPSIRSNREESQITMKNKPDCERTWSNHSWSYVAVHVTSSCHHAKGPACFTAIPDFTVSQTSLTDFSLSKIGINMKNIRI